MHRITLLIIAVLMQAAGYAQNDTSRRAGHKFKDLFYYNAGAGYAIGYTGDINGKNAANLLKVHTYTMGLNGMAGIGYPLNKYAAIELNGIYYATGAKYTRNFFSKELQSSVLLMPGIVMHTAKPRLNMYTRIALALPLSTKLRSYYTWTDSMNNIYSNSIKSRFTLGFSVSGGVSYKLGPHLNIWAEVNSLSYSPYDKQGTLSTTATSPANGTSTYRQQVINYTFTGVAVSTYFNPTPQTQPAASEPFSNIGVQAGITVNFGDRVPATDALHPKRYWYIIGGSGYSFPCFNYADYLDEYFFGWWKGIYSGHSYISQIGSYTPSYVSANDFREKRTSFTAGVSAIAGIGYMFDSHFGLELDVRSTVISRRYDYKDTVENSVGKKTADEMTSYAHPVLLTPCIVMQTGGKRITAYSKLGLVLPLSNKVHMDWSGMDQQSNYSTSTEVLTTRMTLGYTASLGLKYPLTERLKLWAEINALSYQPYVKEHIESSLTINGVPHSPFSKYTFGVANGDPTFLLPYSSAGVLAGVSFEFSR